MLHILDFCPIFCHFNFFGNLSFFYFVNFLSIFSILSIFYFDFFYSFHLKKIVYRDYVYFSYFVHCFVFCPFLLF